MLQTDTHAGNTWRSKVALIINGLSKVVV